MPQLISEQIETIELPEIDGKPHLNGSWVTMDVSPLKAGDTAYMSGDMTEAEAGIRILAKRIKDWSYESEPGQIAPVTVENVGGIDVDHYAFLMQKITVKSGELTTDEKKDLNPSSAQSIPVVQPEAQ